MPNIEFFFSFSRLEEGNNRAKFRDLFQILTYEWSHNTNPIDSLYIGICSKPWNAKRTLVLDLVSTYWWPHFLLLVLPLSHRQINSVHWNLACKGSVWLLVIPTGFHQIIQFPLCLCSKLFSQLSYKHTYIRCLACELVWTCVKLTRKFHGRRCWGAHVQLPAVGDKGSAVLYHIIETAFFSLKN